MASDDPTEMVWEKMWVGRPDGTHFSSGGSSPLARDDGTNSLDTHATLGPRVEDDDEDDEGPEALRLALALGAGVLLGIGAIKAAPRVKEWWLDLRARRSKRVAVSEPVEEVAAHSVPVLSSTTFAGEVEVAVEEHRTKMSSQEAQERILAVLMAAAFIADQMRALSGAKIEDDAPSDLRAALEKLTAPQLAESLNRMLESDSSLLDESTLDQVMEIFGGGRVVEGEYLPLRTERIREALRLPDVA